MGATGTLAHVHEHMSTLRCQCSMLPLPKSTDQKDKRMLVCCADHLVLQSSPSTVLSTEKMRRTVFRVSSIQQ
eukprot:6212157-Pleurochrysis_carterae.AAC.5